MSVRNVFKVPELRRRILWTLGLLVVFRIGSHLPLPGLDPDAIRAFAEQAAREMGSLWSLVQMFTGGAIGHLAIFSLGIAPYVTASIAVQLLTKVHPALETIAKEGPRGQRRLRQITLYATVPVCLAQASLAVGRMGPPLVEGGVGVRALLVAGLTAGSLFLVWLGEQITERGLGNGASILIMAGITARLPEMLAGTSLPVLALTGTAVVATVFLSLAQRRIPLQHASRVRGRRVQLGGRNYLPLRVLGAGVMPIVFASSALVIPALLGWRIDPAGFPFVLYHVVAIVFLSYFWTYVFHSPAETAQQLREHGSFIPGIRPGGRTADYLDGILSRMTLFGALCLSIIALLPGFLGGSALLIVVGVCLDLIRKADAALAMHRYEGFLK